MTIIVQRVRDFVYGENILSHGLVAFLLDDCFGEFLPSLKLTINRICKLKAWNNRTENLSQMKAAICFVVKDEEQTEKTQLVLKSDDFGIQQYFIIHNEEKLKYKNDGPCTFIFN